jgi:flagellar protein FlaG
MTGAIESAILLIVAVICAAILAMAVYPAIFTMAGTFSSASHTADQNIRTDFKIVLATSNQTGIHVWMKNVGTTQISMTAIANQADVACGDETPPGSPIQTFSSSSWTASLADSSNSGYWGPGQMLEVDVPSCISSSSSGYTDEMYFQFILPNGVSQSVTFSGRTTS